MSRRRRLTPRFDRLDQRALLATGLTPAQLIQSYGFNVVPLSGAGQTIAIVDAYHDPNLAGDLARFDATYNLPGQSTAQVAGLLSQVDLSGGRSDDGWAEEEALDVEWAHAAAPAARIVVVEARSSSLGDLMSAVNVARNIPGVAVVSMSWGTPEFPQQTAYDSIFTTPAGHTPVTLLAASGDDGAFHGAEWPASSPNVIAVGGTSLVSDAAGNRLYESGWNGSGGGVSRYEAEPSYQAATQATGRRTTPDVAIDANPRSGLSVYLTPPSTGRGYWEVVGGTSASTQIWAGVIANADQVRTMYGFGGLDTAATLSALYRIPWALNDIASGYNGYQAATGYDLVTGLGTPQVFPVYYTLNSPSVVAGGARSATVVAAASTSQATPAIVPGVAAPGATVAPITFVAIPAAPATTPPAALHASATPAVGAAIGAPGSSQAPSLVPQPLRSGPSVAPDALPADPPPAPLDVPPSGEVEPEPAADAAAPPAEDAPTEAAPATPVETRDASPAPPLDGEEPAPNDTGAAPPESPGPMALAVAGGLGGRLVEEPAAPVEGPEPPVSLSPGDPGREHDRGADDGPVPVPGVGVALAAALVLGWRRAARDRPATPRGPGDAFRTPDGRRRRPAPPTRPARAPDPTAVLQQMC